MTREDIIRMAQEAGLAGLSVDHLERFAKRVAAAEREACARKVEKLGMEGYGTLAIAGMIREQIDD